MAQGSRWSSWVIAMMGPASGTANHSRPSEKPETTGTPRAAPYDTPKSTRPPVWVLVSQGELGRGTDASAGFVPAPPSAAAELETVAIRRIAASADQPKHEPRRVTECRSLRLRPAFRRPSLSERR